MNISGVCSFLTGYFPMLLRPRVSLSFIYTKTLWSQDVAVIKRDEKFVFGFKRVGILIGPKVFSMSIGPPD